MSELETTKVCPLCAETIKSAAKICPFCQSRQSRFAISGNMVVPWLGGVSLVLVLAVFALIVPGEKVFLEQNFARHREDLAVHQVVLGQSKGKPEFWLTGMVTNRSEHPWRIHELEVRFLDSQNHLLDVRNSEVKELFVVQAHQEHAFRVELGSLVFTNTDVSHQIRVQTATDGNRPFNKD